MTIVNHGLNRRIRQALYALKRGFGSTVKLYKLIDTGTDYETGAKTIDSSVLTIHRCIVLPARIQREVVNTISIISANKSFVYGGSYDADTRLFVIDARDLPKGYNIQLDDWLEYDNHRFNPKIIEELEPCNRGLFGGVVGYFDFSGNADLAIAIRTAGIRSGIGYVQAGAGIVLDSDAQLENQETIAKASAPLRAIAAANSMNRVNS
jgi:hypothetical protein